MSGGIRPESKVALVFANNEILLGAVKKVLEELGYGIRQDFDSALDARFAVVGAYFACLGIVKHLQATNPLLPILILETGDYKLNGFLSAGQSVYDVIRVDDRDEAAARRKLKAWFLKGNGNCLLQEGTKIQKGGG